jgi:hypothetical protein
MNNKPTRTQLKKSFFSGHLNAQQFKDAIEDASRYRGFYVIPGQKPKWSGPFRDTKKEAQDDNAPYFNQGYHVDVYEEQIT